MVYKDGVSNVHTRDFTKEIYKALMENHHFWFVEKKVVIILQNSQPNIHKGSILKSTISSHFIQEDKYLVRFTVNPNIHYKLDTYSPSMFEGSTNRNPTQ
jgi:hypothetical protein